MKTILVIDDQRAVADSVALVLKQSGYEVRVAYDAEQAIVAAAEERPDLVMLDLSMPVLSGYELARHLRAMYGSGVRLVAHTGWDDEETRRRVSAAGFDAHLTKPASVDELISAVALAAAGQDVENEYAPSASALGTFCPAGPHVRVRLPTISAALIASDLESRADSDSALAHRRHGSAIPTLYGRDRKEKGSLVKTVLVVDDLRDIADSVALILRTHGYDVQVAYDAEQAFACVAETCPDLVVLDLAMPVVSGYEVARRLRALHGSIPYLVAHTAWDDEETKERAAAAGFDAHLRKPASVTELISAIG